MTGTLGVLEKTRWRKLLDWLYEFTHEPGITEQEEQEYRAILLTKSMPNNREDERNLRARITATRPASVVDDYGNLVSTH